ncbi:hypothetical protein M422DRAFT_23743 [Sphaerobolus stellatus SS14]|nr:hypothetical protein M422DRAFT_23743 [Sphaerobolus stellatus SS14]
MQQPGQPPMHFRSNIPPQHMQQHKMSGQMGPNPTGNSGGPQGPGGGDPGNRQGQQQNKPGTMMPPPPSPASAQKNTGMMPPPPQPGSSTPNNVGVKDQSSRSPVPTRLDGAPTSSPRNRPASRSGAGGVAAGVAVNAQGSQQTLPLSQGSTGNPPTPVQSAATTTVPSPSPGMNRISPSAAMNSLPRPQTSGPQDGVTTNGTPSLQTSIPPPTSNSAPPSTGTDIATSLFGDFFNTMEDNFGSLGGDDFSQWIDMNGPAL